MPLGPLPPIQSEGESISTRHEVSYSLGLSEEVGRSEGKKLSAFSERRSISHSSSRKTVVDPKSGLSGNFIKAKSTQGFEVDTDRESYTSRLKKSVKRFQKSKAFSNFMVFVVLFDAYCTCRDIDARASYFSPTPSDAPQMLMVLADVCLLMYTLELALNFWVQGWKLLKDWMVLLDMAIILCGYIDLMLNLIAQRDFVLRLGIFRAFRLARIIRLMRVLRKMRALRELQKLVTMMSTCLKALFWSFVFCFLVMSIWAMFMVEVVNPLIHEMKSDAFQNCPECMTSTGSVMAANLLLFQTVIAGDSWGKLAVPVIKAHPETAIIFVGSLLTLVFGVLNLIVAVVVDTFAEARSRDILNLAEELEYDHAADRKFLQSVFDRMDLNGSGQITFEELVEGARNDQEFQSRLRVMDIDETDLKQLFEMIDTHAEGEINAAEFIGPLSRWVHESKTAPRFIKYNLQRAMQQQDDLFNFCEDCFNLVGDRIDDIVKRLDVVSPSIRTSHYKAHDDIDTQSTEMEQSDLPHLAKVPSEAGVKPSNLDTELAAVRERLEKQVMTAEMALRSSMSVLESAMVNVAVRSDVPPKRPSNHSAEVGIASAPPMLGDGRLSSIRDSIRLARTAYPPQYSPSRMSKQASMSRQASTSRQSSRRSSWREAPVSMPISRGHERFDTDSSTGSHHLGTLSQRSSSGYASKWNTQDITSSKACGISAARWLGKGPGRNLESNQKGRHK
ncbi:unnamed protein product [Durusdinium trenchii]|uniref:EF-hand domain-containing protein n=1 Tax=Durusdinium trenchii TaxID=1381693 RepID=A0ABP0P439_9DINO